MMKGKNFGKLNVPDHWQQYWSRYPQGYTILEALINWVSQVDDMVDNVNDWNEYLDEFVAQFDEELQQTVKQALRELQESGVLDHIIRVSLQTGLDKVNEDISQLKEEKASKGALTTGLETKRNKDDLIRMTDLSQAVREALTGGSTAVVGVGSVGTTNLQDNAVSNSKINQNILINTPAFEGPDYDLDYVWDVGTRLVFSDVSNNPFSSGYALLNIERVNTGQSTITWLKQTLTDITTNTYPLTYYRVIRVDEAEGEPTYLSEWKRQLNEDDLIANELQHITGISTATNVFNELSEDKRVGGIFNHNGEWIDTFPDYDAYRINVKYKDSFYLGVDDLTIIGFDEDGEMTENFSDEFHFTVENPNTTHFYYVIRRDRLYQYNRMVIRGNFYPDYRIEYGQTITMVDGLTETNEYKGRTWVALGTSITSRGEYVDKVTSTLGLNTDNRGVGSGGITSHAGAGNTTMQAVETIEDFKGIVSVELGANDWGNCPLGELGDTEDSTWYGALDKVCRTITKRTSARPFFITSPRRVFQLGADFDEERRRSVYEVNSFGFSYVDYCNAVKEVTQHYGIPVVDIPGDSGLGGYNNNSETLIDHIHLSDIGGEIMANQIIKFLKHTFSPFPDRYNNPLT